MLRRTMRHRPACRHGGCHSCTATESVTYTRAAFAQLIRATYDALDRAAAVAAANAAMLDQPHDADNGSQNATERRTAPCRY